MASPPKPPARPQRRTPPPRQPPPPKGGGCRQPPLKHQSPHLVPHGLGGRHHHWCPPEESRRCLGGIPRHPHALRGGPPVLVPSPEAAQEHLEDVCKGKRKASPPKPTGQPDPKTNALTHPTTNPRPTSKLTPQVTPKHKTTPPLTPPPTQPNNCGTPKRGLKKCKQQVIPLVVMVVYRQWCQ